MTNARTKLVFGGLTPDDAAILEPFLYMGTYDLQRVKERITTPMTVRHDVVWLDNQSRQPGSLGKRPQSTSTSETISEGRAESLPKALSQSLATIRWNQRRHQHQSKPTIPRTKSRRQPMPRGAHRGPGRAANSRSVIRRHDLAHQSHLVAHDRDSARHDARRHDQ